jgi:hypothetical protein
VTIGGCSDIAVTLSAKAARNKPKGYSRFAKIARVLVRFDQGARCIVNANHGFEYPIAF